MRRAFAILPVPALPVLALCGLVLASCASPRAEQAMLARTALVGLSKTDLLACAGVPPRTHTEAGQEYWTYGSEQVRGYAYGPTFGLGFGTYGGDVGVGYGLGFPIGGYNRELSSSYCEATFILDNDRVLAVNYRSAAGYGEARFAQCYYIVDTCMALVQSRMPAQAQPQPQETTVSPSPSVAPR